MNACKSCGAYGGSQHSPQCGTRTGKRFVYELRTARAAATDRDIAKRGSGS